MAEGDLTLTTIYKGSSHTAAKTAVDAENLAAVTDTIHAVTLAGRDQSFWIFKVEREA